MTEISLIVTLNKQFNSTQLKYSLYILAAVVFADADIHFRQVAN